MSLSKNLMTLVAPVALLALSACATGFSTQVSRFQAMPAPQGQSFYIQAERPENRGGLEFGRYADLVRRHLVGQGFTEAASPGTATLAVTLDYGVDNGQTKVVSTPGFGGYGGFYDPFYPRFYYGRRHPFFYGWRDPMWDSALAYPDVHSYTVFTSYLDMDIRRTADGQSLFEGTAKARSRTDQLQVLVPNLVEAMFTGFPGSSGETVKITVPPPGHQRG
ncbi:MAG TPA: DUF4136 domain-containing protein [Allosphingosinicella sp.]|jgi:hypothetical protein